MTIRPDAEDAGARTVYATLRTENRGGVLVVHLARPDSMNAFTVRMADELEHLFRAVNDDDSVGAVVVTGEGRAFCAGMDLASAGNVFGLDESLEPTLTDLDPPWTPEIERGVRDTGGRVTLAIYDCLKPVVAAVNGAAVGIGATMILAMDSRLAAPEARIGFVFGRLGITPEACSTWFLPRIVGMPTALHLFFSADVLSGEDALEVGLVDRIVPQDTLVDEAVALARSWIDGRSPVALAMARQMVLRNAGLASPHEAHAAESLSMFYLSRAGGAEGVAAFRAKRPAVFEDVLPGGLPPFYDEWVNRRSGGEAG